MNLDCLAGLVILGLLVATLLIVLSANETRRVQGANAGIILYDGQLPDAAPLVAHALHLAAQPTLVSRAADGSVTVIVAIQAPTPTVVRTPMVVRLVAEALVAEEALGVRVTRGIVQFRDRMVVVPITPALRALVLHQLALLRAAEDHGPRLNRQEASVCRTCAYRAMCAIGRANAPLPHSSMR